MLFKFADKHRSNSGQIVLLSGSTFRQLLHTSKLFVDLFRSSCCHSDSSKLTKHEKKNLDYKRKVLSLAKEHRSAADLERVDRYYMPRDNIVSCILHTQNASYCHHTLCLSVGDGCFLLLDKAAASRAVFAVITSRLNGQ